MSRKKVNFLPSECNQLGLPAHFVGITLATLGLAISSCTIIDLKDDIDEVRENYGYLKGSATGPDDGSNILVALIVNEPNGTSIIKINSTSPDEPFYMLVPKADYALLAFSDTNGDFAYQSGEPAARVDDPFINWFSTMDGQDRVAYKIRQRRHHPCGLPSCQKGFIQIRFDG